MHAPLAHAGDALATPVVHAVAELHVPFDWHDSRPVPEHIVCVGAHTPVHAPLTHVWLVHAVAELHVPFDWHDSTPLPEHVVWLGAHTPAHAPLTHV